MASLKPVLAKGTRDFSPVEMAGRNFIFETIKRVFRKYGFQEIQTPSFEMLQTLTGKYGDEGDQLIFKILNSGDFLKRITEEDRKKGSAGELTPKIAEKALRYDLTVPFARYVVMHQNDIPLPFKRYQIQPVWRADRPQKGRYREFYQCDVDVVGSPSLLNEAEFILIYKEALSNLGLKDFSIKLNNRKVLFAIAEVFAEESLLIPMTVAIDKLDKIGFEGVATELLSVGFSKVQVEQIKQVLHLGGSFQNKIESLKDLLKTSSTGLQGISELEEVYHFVEAMDAEALNFLELDITLARGLNYYTGCIFEVKSNEVKMGSIGGGGRYDDLTGMFGLKGLTGVGVSFGADRIYDVLSELGLLKAESEGSTQVLLSHFDSKAAAYALPIVQTLRKRGIAAELYPSAVKLKKQLSYANAKSIPYVLLIGDAEMQAGQVAVRNMQTGKQEPMNLEDFINFLEA